MSRERVSYSDWQDAIAETMNGSILYGKKGPDGQFYQYPEEQGPQSVSTSGSITRIPVKEQMKKGRSAAHPSKECVETDKMQWTGVINGLIAQRDDAVGVYEKLPALIEDFDKQIEDAEVARKAQKEADAAKKADMELKKLRERFGFSLPALDEAYRAAHSGGLIGLQGPGSADLPVLSSSSEQRLAEAGELESLNTDSVEQVSIERDRAIEAIEEGVAVSDSSETKRPTREEFVKSLVDDRSTLQRSWDYIRERKRKAATVGAVVGVLVALSLFSNSSEGSDYEELVAAIGECGDDFEISNQGFSGTIAGTIETVVSDSSGETIFKEDVTTMQKAVAEIAFSACVADASELMQDDGAINREALQLVVRADKGSVSGESLIGLTDAEIGDFSKFGVDNVANLPDDVISSEQRKALEEVVSDKSQQEISRAAAEIIAADLYNEHPDVSSRVIDRLVERNLKGLTSQSDSDSSVEVKFTGSYGSASLSQLGVSGVEFKHDTARVNSEESSDAVVSAVKEINQE